MRERLNVLLVVVSVTASPSKALSLSSSDKQAVVVVGGCVGNSLQDWISDRRGIRKREREKEDLRRMIVIPEIMPLTPGVCASRSGSGIDQTEHIPDFVTLASAVMSQTH